MRERMRTTHTHIGTQRWFRCEEDNKNHIKKTETTISNERGRKIIYSIQNVFTHARSELARAGTFIQRFCVSGDIQNTLDDW